MTDQEIRIAVAEIAGWKVIHTDQPDGKRTSLLDLSGRPMTWDFGHVGISAFGVLGQGGSLPDYPNDANAVIPLLEKWNLVQIHRLPINLWDVHIPPGEDNDGFDGSAPTFAKAACIALIKAHGKWREV